MDYQDGNYADRLGWKEIVVRGGPRIELLGSTAAETDLTDELRRYPDGLLQNTPDQRAARVSIAPGAGRPFPDRSVAPIESTPRARDRFAQ